MVVSPLLMCLKVFASDVLAFTSLFSTFSLLLKRSAFLAQVLDKDDNDISLY
jgi:hypothetical protein